MAFNMYISSPKMLMHHNTIAEMFMIQLENNKGLFGIDCSTGKEYSYPKLKKDVLAVTAVLQEANIDLGDVVMSTDYGTYQGQVVILAGLLIGATIAILDYNLKKETLKSLIAESKPDAIFCSAASVNAICDALNATGHRPTVKISTTLCDGFCTYSDIVSSDNNNNNSFVWPTRSVGKNLRRPCAVVFSSGSTGTPKGVYLSDDAIKSTLINFKYLMEEPIENKFMTSAPMFWYSGILFLLLGVHFGKPRLFFSAQPTAEQILSSIDKFKPTFLLAGVSTVHEMMCCQMANGHKFNIESLATFAVGGSTMRSELQKTITENLLRKRIPIKQLYGSTEQGLVTTWPTKSDIRTVKEGSVGRPAFGIKIKIVSLKTDECVGPNTEGEICTKSASNMMGYAYDTKKTINSYDDDGWFKSGDIGYFTDDGYLYIVGRIKELLIYKHLRIAPTDVETVLLSHAAVLDAGVTSRVDSDDNDVLVGVVKVKPGKNIGPAQLVSYVDGKVHDHEKLRGGVIFVDDVPRTAAGKLNRKQLKLLIEQ